MSEAEPEQVSDAEQPAAPTWELHDEIVKLQSYDPTEVTGERRMGAGMAFRDAAAQVQAVARMVAEIRLDWDRLGPSKRAEIASQVRGFVANVDAMLKMDSGRVDATDESQEWTPEQVRSQRDTYETEITNAHTRLLDNLQPLCVTAPARRAAQEVVREQAASLSEEQVNALRQTFTELEATAQEFRELRPLVEAQRELLGESGTTKLSADFETEADGHAKAWKRWLVALLAWVLVGGAGGVVFIYLTKPPDDATNAQIASHIFLDLLVIGLGLFVIRNFSLQFRAHRHMEVVARNKASALSTFNRIVAGQEPEVKTVVAAALAQAVFVIDENVFGDSGAEHVTILERVLSPGIDRLKSS